MRRVTINPLGSTSTDSNSSKHSDTTIRKPP
jgi:hypothetical protein